MFRHFVLTRFNIKLDTFPSHDKNNRPVHTEEWLENRFCLFEEYCLPSMINQTCTDFIWFVLFDTETPDRFLQKIKVYEEQYPFFKPLFLESGNPDFLRKKFNEIVVKYLGADDQYIITSRIDNDDAFHRDMIRDVQELFNKQENVFVSFIYGLQFDTRRKVLARMHYDNNHFISRIEKRSDAIDTVLTHEHTQIGKVTDVIYIDNRKKPLWLEIIHEGNIINYLYSSSVPLASNKMAPSFALKERISMKNTFFAFVRYVYLHVLLGRNAFLKKLGIYDCLKKRSQQKEQAE
jgi:hypothetical protein